MILLSSVERARVGRDGVRWQGFVLRLQIRLRGFGQHEEIAPLAQKRPARSMRQQASACNEEQRRQRAPSRPTRARSAVTQMVKAVVMKKINNHERCQRVLSGQLRKVGS